jgi:DNA-binding response OmpR family regulator
MTLLAENILIVDDEQAIADLVDAEYPKYIKTVWGVGYKIEK